MVTTGPSGVVVADNHSHSSVSLHSHSSSDHGKVGEDVAMVITQEPLHEDEDYGHDSDNSSHHSD